MTASDPAGKADLLVSGRYLLPTWRHGDHLADGAVAVSGDTIVATGTRAALTARFPDAEELHEPAGLIMPGLVNTHTHAPMSYLRGVADDLPLMTWLQDHIFPVEAKLTADMVHLSTLLSIAEMIKSGTTSFCDMYLFAGEVARAAAEAGMRAWVGEALYDFPSPCYGELENGFTVTRELCERYRDDPLISATVTPHSVYTCAPELLIRCRDIAAEFDTTLVVHLAETETEVQTCLAGHGRRPVAHLENLGIFAARVLAAHCVHLLPDEMALLAERRVSVTHCVESNMKLASGTAPIPELLRRGVTVSIGTDGPASNNDVDMFAEMSSVAKVHKLVSGDPTVMDAETTLRCATAGGAAALGVDGEIGTIEAGKQADIIVLDCDQPHLTPLYNIPSHLVYAARGGDVVHSLVGGRLLMRDRRLCTIDEAAVIAAMHRLQETVTKIGTGA